MAAFILSWATPLSSRRAARRISTGLHSRALTLGWLLRRESGTYVKFTPVGAELFA